MAEVHADAALFQVSAETRAAAAGVGVRVRQAGHWIVGNHVEQRRAAGEQLGQLGRVRRAVVEAGQQHVFERQLPAGLLEIVVGLGQNIGERNLFG